MLNCLSGKQSSFEIGFGIFTLVSKQIRISQVSSLTNRTFQKTAETNLGTHKIVPNLPWNTKKRFISQACKPHSDSKTVLESKKAVSKPI